MIHEQQVPVRGRHAGATAGEVLCAGNLLAGGGQVVFFKDLKGRFIAVSAECARINGRTQDEMLGLTDFDLTDHAHAVATQADERRIIATGVPVVDKEEVLRTADHQTIWWETSKFALCGSDGKIVGTFGISRDVTRWELAEREITRMVHASAQANAELTRLEAQLRAVLDGSTDVIATYDRELRCTFVNPAGERARGSSLAELTGRTDREAGMAAGLLRVWEPALRRVLETGEPGEVEFRAQGRRSDGSPRWFHASLSPERDMTGTVVGVLTSTRDITEVKRAEQDMTHRATHDFLTGLANRPQLTDRMNHALARMGRHPGHLVLFFIDLDHFKDINATYGHEVGDRVLIEVARRLIQVARQEDTVARLGGDEFIVLCEEVRTGDDVPEIARRILGAMAVPFDDESRTIRLSASVGAVATTDPAASASGLVHDADAAMYRAKRAGGNHFEVSGPTSQPAGRPGPNDTDRSDVP